MHPKSQTLLEVHIFMKEKGRKNKKYSPEFKIAVIMDMRENHLGYREVTRKYWGLKTERETSKYVNRVIKWERIYLEEGEVGFMTERRGRKSTGRPKKPLSKSVEEDLIAENQRLRMEIEYLKKLDALVRKEEQEKNKKQ